MPGSQFTAQMTSEALSNSRWRSPTTIQFAEYNGPAIHWMSPTDLRFASMSFVPGHPAGIDSQYLEPAVAMADGAVQRLSAEVTPAELRAMCTANGHESELPDSHTVEMEGTDCDLSNVAVTLRRDEP